MMKRGEKRPALFDSATDISDPTDGDLRSKRVMEAPSFDVHRAVPSHQQLVEGPTLDVQRANLSLQYVRALNRQFASWIQSQLENHLDELWEDGANDYLSHASHIMEEFKDVVRWLRENAAKSVAAKSQNSPCTTSNGKGSATSITNLASSNVVMPSSFLLPKPERQPSLVPPSSSASMSKGTASGLSPETNLSTSQGVKPPSFPLPEASTLFFSSQSKLNSNMSNGFAKMVPSSGLPIMPTPSLFSTSQNVGFISSDGTKSSVFPGFSSSVPPKVDASGDTDEEGELEQPSSPSLKKTQETGISIVHEAKCKVYIKPDDPAENGWKDMGTGLLSIKCKEGADKATKESKPTIIVRNDVGRVLLNALIYPGIKMNVRKNSIVTIFHTCGEGTSGVVSRTFLLRLKTVEETNKLAETINEYSPTA
ncbi:hypothetical protein HPP92_020989 [Vanilla planifolia]|uniref:RanBD1 domain-containing protein n=1 Tax=Vanilla planifolia TaxID=51239 RepID=A0A835Q3C7_VANPL|nr:hypothetical protein HPP92_020989 [Vanilla planifolia]